VENFSFQVNKIEKFTPIRRQKSTKLFHNVHWSLVWSVFKKQASQSTGSACGRSFVTEVWAALVASAPSYVSMYILQQPLKNIPPWKIFTPERYSPLKNIHPWKIVTTEKYSPLGG
jgi:hypothetical protein